MAAFRLDTQISLLYPAQLISNSFEGGLNDAAGFTNAMMESLKITYQLELLILVKGVMIR
jgi:hypothetical protein